MLSLLETIRIIKRGLGAARAWLGRLQEVSLRDTRALFDKIPSDRISPVAIDFAQKMLELNHERLLDVKET